MIHSYKSAYDIDFDGKIVSLRGSNGSDILTAVLADVSASGMTKPADQHLGEPRLNTKGTDAATAYSFWSGSGICKKNAPITAKIAGPFAVSVGLIHDKVSVTGGKEGEGDSSGMSDMPCS
ncbi:hypothetical protein F1880_007943 [Penicillium rolfsii]|nr:hypothetical protein F1880_007943 [Penicillium rolfsii]